MTKLDSRRRGVFPAPFQPGDVMVREVQNADSVTFRLVKPAEVDVVPAVRRRGRIMLGRLVASHDAIADAIRAERDGR